MGASKFLLDANIVIALEDPKILSPTVAAFAKKATLHGLAIFLDEACMADIQRDPNLERRASTLSKLNKFPLLEGIAHQPLGVQIARFGAVKNDNDRCDVLMLDTLDLGIVDFLVTEDLGIHRRAEGAGLRDRVFTTREALSWIQRTYEPKDFRLRYIVARKAHQISTADPIFETLREDYSRFDDWFATCRRQHRDCWTAEINGELAGLVIRKDETHSEAETRDPGPRILKICTLKMKPEFLGERFGEQLLKKILWFAQGNQYNLVYLTVFPKQEVLITLLSRFGFAITQTRSNGEFVMERTLMHGELAPVYSGGEALDVDFRAYPRFYDGASVGKYVIPIQPEFHKTLFPEIAEPRELPLFPLDDSWCPPTVSVDRTPGNTIRKVYVCRSPTRTLASGDILLFYLSKSSELVRSQTLTTIGVVEHTQLAGSSSQLLQMVGRRSVFSKTALESMLPSGDSPVLVIDFLLSGHLSPSVPLAVLIKDGVFARRPPQSIKSLDEVVYHRLRPSLAVSFQ